MFYCTYQSAYGFGSASANSPAKPSNVVLVEFRCKFVWESIVTVPVRYTPPGN